MGFFDQVQAAGKAVFGGVAGAIISVLFTTVTDADSVVNPDAPDTANTVVQLPNTQAEWVTFVIAVIVGFALPWLKRNFPSVPTARAQLDLAERRVAEGKQAQ